MGCLQLTLIIALILAGFKQIEALPSPSLNNARAGLLDDSLKGQKNTDAAEKDKVDHLPGLPGNLDSDVYAGHATILLLPLYQRSRFL